MLLEKLRQDAGLDELARLIKQDAALSLRLLRYVNTGGSNFPDKTSSITSALKTLGRVQLRRWLTLLLCITCSEQTGRSAAALESALIRARMMELLGQEHHPEHCQPLFLTGLLSLADDILQEPMESTLASLDIAPEIADAVIQRKGRYADLLDLTIACEQQNLQQLRDAAARCNITPAKASIAHIKALQWSLTAQPEIG